MHIFVKCILLFCVHIFLFTSFSLCHVYVWPITSCYCTVLHDLYVSPDLRICSPHWHTQIASNSPTQCFCSYPCLPCIDLYENFYRMFPGVALLSDKISTCLILVRTTGLSPAMLHRLHPATRTWKFLYHHTQADLQPFLEFLQSFAGLIKISEVVRFLNLSFL